MIAVMNEESTLMFNDIDQSEYALANDRAALAPAQRSLQAAGFYAYSTLDDQNRWTVAVDDELGRVDVHIGHDGYEVTLWASSPGLYADEENEWRRQARERLARIRLPSVARGFLDEHQTASWEEVDAGIAVSCTYELPFNRGDDIGAFAREHLPGLEEVLTTIERQIG